MSVPCRVSAVTWLSCQTPPPPGRSQVEWRVNGSRLEPSERVEMATQGGQTTLDIPISVRGDSGTYTLTLTNDHGEDSASATVTVLGR